MKSFLRMVPATILVLLSSIVFVPVMLFLLLSYGISILLRKRY